MGESGDSMKSVQGRAQVWATRHHEIPSWNGLYAVTMTARCGDPSEYTELHDVPGHDCGTGFYFSASFPAVIDDFGRLVRVAQ